VTARVFSHFRLLSTAARAIHPRLIDPVFEHRQFVRMMSIAGDRYSHIAIPKGQAGRSSRVWPEEPCSLAC